MNMHRIERALMKDVGRSWREENMILTEEFVMICFSTRQRCQEHGSSMCIGEDIYDIVRRRNARNIESQGE